MLSLINAIFGVGAILGPLAVSATDTQAKAVFLVAGVLAPLGLSVANLDQPPESRAPASRGTGFGAHRRVVLAFLTLGFLYAGMETGIGAWEATHLDRIGHTAANAARPASLFWVGLCVGRFVIPAIARRLPPGAIPLSIAGIAIASTAMAILIPRVLNNRHQVTGHDPSSEGHLRNVVKPKPTQR